MTKLMTFLRNLFGMAKDKEKPAGEKKADKAGHGHGDDHVKAEPPRPIVREPFVPIKFEPGATLVVRDIRPYMKEEPPKKEGAEDEKKADPPAAKP